jgi:hypothetical protein
MCVGGSDGRAPTPGDAPGPELPSTPFERLLVVHRGPVIERDLLDYAAWLAACIACRWR